MPNQIAYLGNIYGYGNSDKNVMQSGGTVINSDYEVLFAGSPGDVSKIEGTKKCKYLKYNPCYGDLSISKPNADTKMHITNNDVVCENAWFDSVTSLRSIIANRALVRESDGYVPSGLLARGAHVMCELKQTDFAVDTSADNHVATNEQYGFAVSTVPAGTGGKYAGRAILTAQTDGALNFKIQVRNYKTDGTEVNNAIGASALKDGSQTYNVTNAANFRTAIGAAAASSRLTKKYIKAMTYKEAKKILDINVVSFDYKDGFVNSTDVKEKYYGVIAEEIMEDLPYVVHVPEGYNADEFDESRGLQQRVITVDYVNFIPYLIKVIQNQEARIAKLEEKIKEA